MVFIICVVVGIAGILAAKILSENDYELATLFSGIIGFLASAAAILMTLALAISYINCPKTEARWQEQYKSLNTRIENHLYYPWDRNELVTEVQEWNMGLAAQQKVHGNFWIGIFNPESIEGLDYINLTSIE